MRTSPFLLVLAACIACSGQLSAETVLEEVRVTGQRNLLGQDLLLRGMSQSIAPAEQVSMNRTIGDWIERLPGVSLNGQGGLLQSYSIRGFSRWRIRTEVDGVPIITDRRAGNSASFVPPELLQRVEVSRGPGSSLYGSGAMGGVVSLESIAPEGLEVSVRGQSNDNAFSTTIAYGQPDVFTAALSVRRAQNASDARGNELNTGYEQVGVLLKTRRVVGDLAVTASWLPSYGRDIGKSSSAYPDQTVTDYPEELHSVAIIQIEGGTRWLARFYHHFQDWESLTDRIGVRSNETEYESHTFGGLFYASTDYLSGIGRYGLEWVGRRDVTIRDTEYDAGGQIALATQPIDGEQDNLGAFVDHQWHLGTLGLGGGLRYDYVQQSDHDRDRSDGNINANASVDWTVSEGWLLSSEVGTGFRFPSLTELYFNGVTPRGDTLGNPELDPESSKSVQLGAEFTGDGLSAFFYVYYNDLDNYIERYRVNEDIRSYRNLDEADIWGYEAQLSWQPGERWMHTLSYQWQRGEDQQGEVLADLNPPSWRYLVTWEGPGFQLQNDLLYRQSRDDYGEGEQSLDDSAWIWNVRVTRSWGERWQTELYVSNLLDEQYLGTADEDAAYQSGRAIGISVQWVLPE